MRRLGKAQRTRIRLQRKQKRTLRHAVYLEWESTAPDHARILAISEDMYQSNQALLEEKVDFRLAVYGILSPKQRALARNLRKHRMEHRRKRRLGSDGSRALKGPDDLSPNGDLPEGDDY